ncbi:MAG TPA: ComEC/Rec2 family competence protein [Parafilimonas sp.]|nr:ComEC/Rec2 family competence protein [Parafilimonas sp.]
MPLPTQIPVKNYPFTRLVIALVAGIMAEWYLDVPLKAIIVFACICLGLACSFGILSSSKKFLFGWLRGLFILFLFVSAGMILTWQQNIHHDKNWYGNIYSSNPGLLVTIKEPLIEKANSYKTLAEINAVYAYEHWLPATGNILLYFKKDSFKPVLQYGSQILFNKSLQPIQNSRNPAAFDYNRYCLFQDITAQVFLSSEDYHTSSLKNINVFQELLLAVRGWALQVLRQNINSPKELGIAEALLIGYRNDLDKELIQAYSNTGVVHIIAISGLHIGVIYSALVLFFSLFKSYRIKRWFEPVFILLIIWLFTLIAGGAPSVLRAAVMFTFILAGKVLNKNGNIYNTLAASAFILLISNPFFLWDVGFQLSYAAVFSIVLFYKPVNALLYFKNKSLRWIWQLSAVSLSAQIFTLPLVIYHFHQLPLLFLFSNLLAVPLSGIVLFAELILFCFSWWHSAAVLIGFVAESGIRLMNAFIEHIDKFSFSVWDGLHISFIQLILLLIATCLFAVWLFYKNTRAFVRALTVFTLFFVLRTADIIHHKLQQKIIVYNIPKQSAVDVIIGNTFLFTGDSAILQNAFLKNFNLRPARIKNRVHSSKDIVLPNIENCVLSINSSSTLMLAKTLPAYQPKEKMELNILILSRNTVQTPEEINNYFKCDYIVADGSIPLWKAIKWKKEFEQLHLRFYSVAQDGAFTINL